MTNRTYGWILIVLVLVFAVAAIFAYRRNHQRAAEIPTANNLAVFHNEKYGYTFYYPADYTVRVASDENIIIGTALTSFVPYVNVTIATGTAAAGSYDAFVGQAALSACGSSCTGIADTSDYTAQTNLAGKELYLSMKDGSRFGPVFAFNIGGNVVNAAYATVLVYRPADASGSADAFPAQDVAGKLDIAKVEQRP